MGRRIDIDLEIEIAASPSAVWTRVTDHERMPDWMPVNEVVRRRAGHPEPDGVGAVRTIRSRGRVVEEEITEFRSEEYLGYRLTAGAPLRDHRGELVLTPKGEGSHLRWSIRCRCPFPLIGRWVEDGLRTPIEIGLDRLKRELESREGGANIAARRARDLESGHIE